MKYSKEEIKELNQFYEELKRIVWEKAYEGYEIHPDALQELNYLKKGAIYSAPFFVACSVCGALIKRTKNFKNPVCFECKRKRQKELNEKYRKKKNKK